MVGARVISIASAATPIAIKKSATEITARNAISSACSVAALQNDAIRDGRERVVNGARGLQVEMVFMVSVLKQVGEKRHRIAPYLIYACSLVFGCTCGNLFAADASTAPLQTPAAQKSQPLPTR
jgi:hypothetical protein